MIAKTITINFQTRNGETTTPKGRTRRTVPMTAVLHEALNRMSTIREGLVVRHLDSTAMSDNDAGTYVHVGTEDETAAVSAAWIVRSGGLEPPRG